MLRVALTGGIATGKSYCLQRFAAQGVPTIDADVLAREAVAPGTAGLAAVAVRFGTAVLRTDGTLDRTALGRIVFADSKARASLEAIVHPEVYRRIRDWFANQPSGVALAIADIPLLFETGHQHDFDEIIVAACDREEQMRRVMARDGLSQSEALDRLSAQWPIDEKVKRANRVIWTDRSFSDTDAQIRAIYESLSVDG
ncbi:MAG TPA: dephospho-CoA kinase [Vicinamibacterales bacterium]|jgi:dephospho-CoA kinase|nr:dephospho-CoA kinase [Vicinamibacterales bacterium]